VNAALDRYKQANDALEALIERTPTPEDSSREAVRQRAEIRMNRLVRFLDRLGNPHRGYPIVHIGGTSGKGSTSTAMAAILHAAGYRTGLHTSPYLQVSTEKLQINGRLVDPGTFADLAGHLLDEHERWIASGNEALTYGEAWIALTVLFFRHEKVEVAVVEVGAGGRFDLTNILTPVLSVVTSVGIDHTATLGPTIEDIAWHKAGIIKAGIPAVSAVLPPSAQEIIRQEAREVGADLTEVNAPLDIEDIEVTPGRTWWTERATGFRYAIGLGGGFQAANGQTAVIAARTLDAHGLPIGDESIRQGLLAASIPGRAELIPGSLPILLDGAHNHDKIEALARDLPRLLPVSEGGRRIGVVGALEAKNVDGMLELLTPHLDAIVATSPYVLAKQSRRGSDFADMIRNAGFAGPVYSEEQPEQAIEQALAMAQRGGKDAVLVTGSLYLVGNIRKRWYPDDDIVLAQSSWPAPVSSEITMEAT